MNNDKLNRWRLALATCGFNVPVETLQVWLALYFEASEPETKVSEVVEVFERVKAEQSEALNA